MKGYPVVTTFPVHWGEMDAFGHVNNARYFTWFESARMALFERIGLATTGEPEEGPILAHTSCDFRRPITYPATVAVGARITRVGTTSFVMEYAVAEVETPDHPAAEGVGVVVLFDYRRGTKVEIPESLRRSLEELSGGGSGAQSEPDGASTP